jgi:hypothetical protein
MLEIIRLSHIDRLKLDAQRGSRSFSLPHPEGGGWGVRIPQNSHTRDAGNYLFEQFQPFSS